MIETEAADVQTSTSENLRELKTPAQIIQKKISDREEFIEKLTALLSISFKKSSGNPGRGGLSGQQKWFSISASLAQTLARLVSDLEYEKMRFEVDELKKKVLQGNVRSKRIIPPQPRHGMDRQEHGEQ